MGVGLILIGAVSYTSVRSLRGSSGEVDHTYRVLQTIEQVSSSPPAR